ncbi:hypothetical protein BH23BAC1_BH23BAC1_45590 [soil metagenome]
MKLNVSFFSLVAVTILFLGACERPPELSSVPIIEFESVEYRVVEGRADSLIITISFEDNEGDLGVDRVNDPPAINYPKDAQGNYISISSSPDLPPYHACDYIIDPVINGVQINDTILYEMDQDFYNYRIDFYRKINGQYREFDIRREFGVNSCLPKDRNYFRLNTQPNDRPLQGSLRYAYGSIIFGTVFRPSDTLRVDIQIMDRALNKSNIVSSPDFTLNGVKVE